MSLSSQPLYNVLIRRSMDLQQLCEQASRQVAEPGLRTVLQENAVHLATLVLDLQMQLAELGGRPATRGRWIGALQRRTASWWMRSTPVRDDPWIRLLARSEASLLQIFEETIALAPASTALALRRLLPGLKAVHLDMHSLAGALH